MSPPDAAGEPTVSVDAVFGSLAGRVALITGGAGAIGSATAASLAQCGVTVIIVDQASDRTHEVVNAINHDGGRAVPIVADLTVPGALERAFSDAEQHGPIDILINGLGEHLAISGRFEDSSPEEWEQLYKVNLLHVFGACRAVVPGMRRRGWGRIVNFSSVEGIRSAPLHAVYSAYKGAIDSFTKSLAVDLAGYGVNVNAIAVDKTRAFQTNHYDLGEEYESWASVWIPAGRYGEGIDIAWVVLFLVSDLGSWVVGQTIAADGGTLAAGGWYRTPTRFTNSPLLVQYLEDDPTINAGRPQLLQ